MSAANSAEVNTHLDRTGKRMIKRSFLLISGKVLRLAVQLAVVIIYARQLSYIDYGTYQSVWLYINMLSIFSLFGLPTVLLSHNHTHILLWIKKHKKKFIFILILLNVLPMTGLLLLVGTFTMQEKSLLLILTIVQNISIITETLALKNGFDKKVLLSNIFFSVGFLICHLATLYHGYSLQLLLGGLVLIFMIKSIFVINRNFKLSASESADADISMAGRQWFYLGINDILGVLATWLDKWLILIFLTLTQFAIYFNGAYEVPLFGLMLGAVGNIMMIELAKKEGNDAGKIKLIFEKSSLFLASFVFPGFCFLLFYHAPFFMLIFGEKYIESIPVFFVSIFILPARTIYSTAVLQVYGKSNLIVKGAVLDILLAVILMLLLYPYFKMPGLALAFVLSSYFQLAFYLWQTSRLINKKITYFIPYKELSIKFIISFIIMLTGYFSFNYLAGNKSLITGIILSGAIAGFFFVYDLKKNRKNIQE